MKNLMFKLTLFSLLAIGLLAVSRAFIANSGTAEVQYKTSTVERRTLSSTISATGTLEPCDIIDVGAQVAGRVIEFGVDSNTGKSIDYGSYVAKGMVLAKIDTSVYEIEVEIAAAQARRTAAQVSQAISQLKESEGALSRSEAELRQQQSRFDRSKSDWSRVIQLSKSSALSDAEIDTYRSDMESFGAAVEVAKAAIEQAKSRIETQRSAIEGAKAEDDNARAVLKRAQTTLSYCSILSPINGTVIDRRVNQGQTVVASLSTPSLFLLASDLRELEIWVSVNEADIGRIRPGLPVRFTVDSHPDKRYQGSVKQVRLNASMSQNVVTYTVVVSVENTNADLLPYLTANVEFIVDERKGILSVPNAALRFSPSNAVESSLRTDLNRTVWIRDKSGLHEVMVTVGVSEGNFTEVESERLTEGTEIVLGESTAGVSQSMSNPFVPKMPGTKKD
jgi:HlyD family secretion protein